MTKILLPVQLNPISRRKDRSVKLSLETRELGTDEILLLMSLESEEMWMALTTNQDDMPEAPEINAEVETKSDTQRQRNVLYILWRQATEKGKYLGTFESYYHENMNRIIETLKNKIDD